MVHSLVISVGSKLLRSGVAGLKTFSKYESKVYTGLYGRARGRGVRHGLAAGATIGSLIKSDNGIEPDGKVPFKNGSNANQPNKARGGPQRNGRSSRSRYISHSYCNRYPNARRCRKRGNR